MLVYLLIYRHLSHREESRGAVLLTCGELHCVIFLIKVFATIQRRCSSPDVLMVPFFLTNQGERGRKSLFFCVTSHFFSEAPNSPFLACVSMVTVPRTVWRSSKFGAWIYPEVSVASATPSCQSLPVHGSLFLYIGKMVPPRVNQSVRGGASGASRRTPGQNQ